MRRATQQSDVIEQAADGRHVKAYGRNFKPLVAAGSWSISGFHYGSSRCACCGRPIRHVLHLKNGSHQDAAQRDPSYAFPETIYVGIVCGPKVFTESCVGFYDDPEREWERQIKAWRDFITYTVLCVKNEDLWALVPEELRLTVDRYLESGYRGDIHSGKWWLVKDAKKKLLKLRRTAGILPDRRLVYTGLRTLVYAAKRLDLIPSHWELTPELTLSKEERICA